jgi:uncharacterized protein (DUF983 family)
MRWNPTVPPASPFPIPSFGIAVRRGASNRCPICGQGKVFAGYLRIVTTCARCGAPLGTLRADDAPPYFTILLTGHLLVPGVLWVEKVWMPPMWLHMALWLPLFAALCMLLLRPVKGAVVGWMVTLGFMGSDHGQGAKATPAAHRPEADLPRNG